MKFIDSFNKEKEEEPFTFEKFIFNSAVKSCDFLYDPTEDDSYNERHLLECLMFSSIMHIYAVEISNPTKFQSVKADVFNNLRQIINLSDPIGDYCEMRLGLEFSEKINIIGKEISSLGSRGKMPVLVLGMLYDVPLLEDIYQLEELTEVFNMNSKADQMRRLTRYLDNLRRYIVPNIKNNFN
jgi:hypothetical protein